MGQLKEHLRIIYGEDVIKNLLIKGQKDEQLRSKEDILNALKNFGEKDKHCCKHCFNLNPRHQDFPGWIGPISYKNGKIANKKYLVLGLEIAPPEKIKKKFKKYYPGVDWSYIHIAYDYGYITNIEELKERKLWKYLNYLFPLDKILEEIYVTDIGKCYTKDLEYSREKCLNEHFINELNLFKDSGLIFIMQGRDTKSLLEYYFNFVKDKNFSKYLESKIDILQNCGFSRDKHKIIFEMGTFESKNKDIFNKIGKYLQMPHSSTENIWRWNRIIERMGNELKELGTRIQNYLSF